VFYLIKSLVVRCLFLAVRSLVFGLPFLGSRKSAVSVKFWFWVIPSSSGGVFVQFPFWRFPVVRRFLGDYRPSLLRLSPAISGGQERFRRFRAVLASFQQLFRRSVVLGVSGLQNFLWRRQLRFGYSCSVRVLAVGVDLMRFFWACSPFLR
jgi:hypothetical protein